MNQVLDISTPGRPCRIWFVPLRRDIEPKKVRRWEQEFKSALEKYTEPLPFTLGTNSFGLIDVVEQKEIRPSLLDMMGFRPVSPYLVVSCTCRLIYWTSKRYESFPLPLIGLCLALVVEVEFIWTI